jgi:hypothetical protein
VQWVLDFSWQSKSWCRKADPSSTNTYNRARARWLGLRARVVVDRSNPTILNLKGYRQGRSKTAECLEENPPIAQISTDSFCPVSREPGLSPGLPEVWPT